MATQEKPKLVFGPRPKATENPEKLPDKIQEPENLVKQTEKYVPTLQERQVQIFDGGVMKTIDLAELLKPDPKLVKEILGTIRTTEMSFRIIAQDPDWEVVEDVE